MRGSGALMHSAAVEKQPPTIRLHAASLYAGLASPIDLAHEDARG
jgi:hypothetical protein